MRLIFIDICIVLYYYECKSIYKLVIIEKVNDDLEISMYSKRLIQDPDTNIMIRINRYQAGFFTPWHTHHCAHGMYVMEGSLKTEDGC